MPTITSAARSEGGRARLAVVLAACVATGCGAQESSSPAPSLPALDGSAAGAGWRVTSERAGQRICLRLTYGGSAARTCGEPPDPASPLTLSQHSLRGAAFTIGLADQAVARVEMPGGAVPQLARRPGERLGVFVGVTKAGDAPRTATALDARGRVIGTAALR